MGRNENDEFGTLNGNHVNGTYIKCPTETLAANGTANVTISNVAPAGVGTATISKWLPVNVDGTTYYIPMWT